MIESLLLIFIFMICFVALMVNRILAMRTKSNLNKSLKKRHKEIRRNLNYFEADFTSPEMRAAAFSVIQLILSFGSKNKSRDYWNGFVDVNAIEESEDIEIIRLINRSIKQSSTSSKLWVVMMVSLALAFMFWSKE